MFGCNRKMGAVLLALLVGLPALATRPGSLREREPGQPYSQGRFRDNWSLRAAIGATGPSLALDLSVTKWLSPSIALRGGYQGPSLSDGTTTVGFAYFHGDMLVNLVDLLAGYRPELRWRAMPFLHFGVVSEYDPLTMKSRGRDFATGAGLMGAWQMTKHLSLSVEYRWTAFPGSSAPIVPSTRRSVSTFMGGVEFHFGGRGWKPLSQAEAEGVRVSRFLDNWFVSAGMGVNGITSLKKWNSLPDWAAEVTVGKWFTPRFGVRGGWQGLRLSQSGTSPRKGTSVKEIDGQFRETLGFAYIHGDFLWNFTNTVAPYRQDRLWTVQPYLHMGLMLQYNVSAWPRKLGRRELAGGAGLINAFQLNPYTDIFLDLRVSALRGLAAPDTKSGMSLAPAALLGITRRLGAMGFDSVPDSGYRETRDRGRWAISLNLLDVAQLGTLGVSVQFATSRHITVEITPRINAWSFKEEELYSERQALAIGARWWPWYVYSGFFVKGSAQVEATRRKGVGASEGAGESYGAGLAAGYSWMLTRWLNLDLAAGFWGGRKREPGSLERSWFISPDALTAGVMFVF